MSDKNVGMYESLVIQTLIPKFMGPLSSWRGIIKHASDVGYNAIHFCPFQSRGASNSPYSIHNQLELSDDLFTPEENTKLSQDEKWPLFCHFMKQLSHEFPSMKFISDIVWNHTSFDSSWLSEHPECGYSPDLLPHLKPAVLLDVAIRRFHEDLTASITVSSSDEIRRLLSDFESKELVKWKLWEYWTFDIEHVKANILMHSPNEAEAGNLNIKDFDCRSKVQELCSIMIFDSPGYTWQRNMLDLDVVKALSNFPDLDCALAHLQSIMRNEFEIKMEKMRMNLFNRIYYERLDPSGPLLGPISVQSPFVSPYFTSFPKTPGGAFPSSPKMGPQKFGFNTHEQNVFENWHFLANNGWIWNADPLINFALPPSDAYFVRDIIVWGDCVKLNYPEDLGNPTFLYPLMRAYTERLATIFNGLRLDNCHSTPLFAAKYLLQCAKNVNSSLFVFAELFTGSEKRDMHFIKDLELDCLLRESLAWNCKESVVENIAKIGEKYPVGSVRNPSNPSGLSIIDYSKAMTNNNQRALLMDCTHDNKMPMQYKRGFGFYLANASLVAFSCSSIGSSKGYDECLPKQLDFVNCDYRYTSTDQLKGIEPFKKYLNALHLKLLRDGYNEIYVEASNDFPFLTITRCNPTTTESYVIVINLAYEGSPNPLLKLDDKLESWKLKDVITNTSRHPFVKGATDIVQKELVLKNVDVTIEASARICPVGSNSTEVEMGFKELTLVDFVRIDITRYYANSAQISCMHCGSSLSGSHSRIEKAVGNCTKDISVSQCTVHSYGSFYKEVESLQSPKSVYVPSISSSACTSFSSLSFSPSEHNPTNPVQDPVESEVKIKFSPTGFIDGSVFVFKKSPLLRTRSILAGIDGFLISDWSILNDLTLVDLNILMYRTAAEDLDMNCDLKPYIFPGLANEIFVYNGLFGVVDFLEKFMVDVDCSAVAENFRQGNWFIDYWMQRLAFYGQRYSPRLNALSNLLEQRFVGPFKESVPTYLKPFYLAKYFTIFKSKVMKSIESLHFFGSSCELPLLDINHLSLLGVSETAALFPLPLPKLYASIVSFFRNVAVYLDDRGRHHINAALNYLELVADGDLRKLPTLSAGLTHFATRHMRVWGRDVFLSFVGIFLNPNSTPRLSDAFSHLVAFASVARHSFVIPNLLDSGRYPRYNCRDATWYFLKSCQDFVEFFRSFSSADSFTSIIREFMNFQFPMRFCDQSSFCSYDDPSAYSTYMSFKELIAGILQGNLRGISFLEWNSGPDLDHSMDPKGFFVSTKADINYSQKPKDANQALGPSTDSIANASGYSGTGLIYGGSEYNAGTWMDKVGDSKKAGNWGKPASSRHGAAIEISALLYRTLVWLDHLSRDNLFPSSVSVHEDAAITWSCWKDLIKLSFEKVYYNGTYYRDVISEDLQEQMLRPNALIAMSLAPELLSSDNFASGFQAIESTLVGPIGIRTLDPADARYFPNYDLDDDSENFFVAHGWNYHNGPEWLWLRGYYYMAKLELAKRLDHNMLQVQTFIINDSKKLAQVQIIGGLPELTNANGKFCPFSCINQAWSSAVLIESFQRLGQFS